MQDLERGSVAADQRPYLDSVTPPQSPPMQQGSEVPGEDSGSRGPASDEISFETSTNNRRSPAEKWNEKPKALWRLPTVKAVTGLGRSSIYAKMKDGSFPKAVSLGGGPMVAWISIEVLAWVDHQIAESRKAS